MTSSIGGALETSVIMDASGVQRGADAAKASLSQFEGTADRLAASLENAGRMVELLAAKTLASGSKISGKGTAGISAMVAGMASAAEKQRLSQMIPAGLSESRQGMEIFSGGPQNAINAVNAETSRLREMASLRADIEARNVSVVRNAAAETRAIRDNEHNDIMAKLRQEQAFRDDLRSRLAPGRSMTALMGAAIPSVSPMASAMSGASAADAQYRIATQAAETAEWRRQQAIRLQIKQDARDADQAADRAAVARAAATQAAETAEWRRQQAIRLQIKQDARDADQAAAHAARVRSDQQTRVRHAEGYLSAIMGDMPAEMNLAQQAIARMRADLDPMAGMELRLAEEARVVRNYIRDQVAANRMNVNEAETLSAEFVNQQNLLRRRNEVQHRGFLGMRQMGFAAQQFGYAIEDAASQFGPMGLAGAFRAAGNNLTAMAAQFGATAGVVASLTSAAIALGIQFFNANDALKQSEALSRKRKEDQDRYNNALRETLSIVSEIRSIRERDASIGRMTELGQQIDFLGQMNKRINEAEAKKEAADLAAPIAAAQKRVDELKALSDKFGMSGMSGWVVDILSTAGGGETAEGARLELRKKIAEAEKDLMLAELARQNMERDANAAEIKETQKRINQRHEMIAMSDEMYAKQVKEIRSPKVDTEISLRTELLRLEVERQNLLWGIYDTETEMNEGMAEATKILQDQLKLEERIAQIKRQQAEAAHDVGAAIRAQAEENNSELAERNRREKESAEFYARLDATRMNDKEKQMAAAQYESGIAGNDRIRELQKQEDRLKSLASLTQSPTVLAGIKRGSNEANAIIEKQRLAGMNDRDKKPIVDQLIKVREEIRKQKEALEKIAQARPVVAQF